jgi:hypothetical protein
MVELNGIWFHEAATEASYCEFLLMGYKVCCGHEMDLAEEAVDETLLAEEGEANMEVSK